MSVYAVDELMKQTRKLAADYYQTTQQVLPLSTELAKYDACRLLKLRELSEPAKGVDAIDQNDLNIQVKSRVIFDENNSNYRIGQINDEGLWDKIILVLFSNDYEPSEIYAATRQEIVDSTQEKANPKRSKRGAMSVSKFKNIGKLMWTSANGLEE